MSKKQDKKAEVVNEEMEANVDEKATTNVDDATSNEKEEQKEEKKEPSLEDQYKELQDKYTRLYADFDNFRKRSNKEKLDIIGNATEKVLKEMLPVADDFERAVQNNKETEDPTVLKEGFELIFNKFHHILTTQGVKAMETVGKAFDSEIHEAVANVPAPSEEDKGKIIDDVEKGYYLHDKVIRFAKVVVGQ